MEREIALDVLINERYHLMVLISEKSLVADLRSEIQSVAWEVFPKLRDKHVAVIKGDTGAILPDRYRVGKLLQNGSKVFSFSIDYKRSKNRKRKFLDSESACRKIKRKRLPKHKWPVLTNNGNDRLLNCSEDGYPSPRQINERENLKEHREPVDQNKQSGELPDEISTVRENVLQDKEIKGAGIKAKPASVISHHCDNGGSGDDNANVKDGIFDNDDDDDAHADDDVSISDGDGDGSGDGNSNHGVDNDDRAYKNDEKAERGGRRNFEDKKSKGGEKKTGKDRKEESSSYVKFDDAYPDEVNLPSEMPVIEKNFMEEEAIRRHYPATSSTEVMLSASSDNKDLIELDSHHHQRKRKLNQESVCKVAEWLCASVRPLQSIVNQAGNEDNCSGCETVSAGSCDNEAHHASQQKSQRILTGKADKSDNKGKSTNVCIMQDKEQDLTTPTDNGERKEALLEQSQDDNRSCSKSIARLALHCERDCTEAPLAGVVNNVIDSGSRIQTLRCQIKLTKLPVGANGTKFTGRELIDRTSHDQSGDLNVQERCDMGVSPTEVTGPITRSQHGKNKTSIIARSGMKENVQGVSTRGEGPQAFEDAFACEESKTCCTERGAVVRDMGVQINVMSVIDSSESKFESGVTDNQGHNIKLSAHEDDVNGDDDMNDVGDDDCGNEGNDHNVGEIVIPEAVFANEPSEPLTGRVRVKHMEEHHGAPSNVLVSDATESSSKGRNLTSQIRPKSFAAVKGHNKCRKPLLVCENNDQSTTAEEGDEGEGNLQKNIESPVELTESVDRRITRSQHTAKSTMLLASHSGLREDHQVLAPVEGDAQNRKVSENEDLDSQGMRKSVKQMETDKTRGNDVQNCCDVAKSNSHSRMANSSTNGDVETQEVDTNCSKYDLRLSTSKRLSSRRDKKGKASQECDNSSKKGLKSMKEKVSVSDNVHEAKSPSKETGNIDLRFRRNLDISDDEAQESHLYETKSRQNKEYSQVGNEQGQSESKALFQTETVQNRAPVHICQAGDDEHVTATWSSLNETFNSDETLKDIDTINCAPQEKDLSLSVDQVCIENDSESETLVGSEDEEARKEDAMEYSVSGEINSHRNGHFSVVHAKKPISQEAESDMPRTVRLSLKEAKTSEKKQLTSTVDGDIDSSESRHLETSVDRTLEPCESLTVMGGSRGKLKCPTKDSIQSAWKDKAETGKSEKLDVLPNGIKSDFSGKGYKNRSANEGSLMEELTHKYKQDDEDSSSDSGSETEGGKDGSNASALLVERLRPFKRGKQVMWWEEGDRIEENDDGGESNTKDNINDQTKAFRTKVDEDCHKEQSHKGAKKKVVSKTGKKTQKKMDQKRKLLSQENEPKENLSEGDKVSKDEKKEKGTDIVCDEAETKVGQEICVESEHKTIEEEFERKETNVKNMDKTTHKRVGSEFEQKTRNEDISDEAKALKRKLDHNSSCEYVIKSKKKRPRDIAKSIEKELELKESFLKDEGSKQNSMKTKTKGKRKKKQTELSTVELAVSPKLQKIQDANTEKNNDSGAFSKNSKQSAIDRAGVVVSTKIDKNGGNVKQLQSENSKTRKKETLAVPKEKLEKSTITDSTQVDKEKEYASQDSVTSMKIEKIKKRRKQKKENSVEESIGLGFHNTQDLSLETNEEDPNHESTVSKEKRKTRKIEVMDIIQDIDNELAIHNTEVVPCSTDENEGISSLELVACKKVEKTKKRGKRKATGLDEKDDASVLDKTQALSRESVVGKEREGNQETAGLIRTEEGKKRKSQRKKCSRKNGNDLVIDDKPESTKETKEGMSRELTLSINVKRAKEKKKAGIKTEEKSKEKLLSISRPEKSEIPEETDGQEQCTNQKLSVIKATKKGKKRREKVEPDSREKSKGMLDNDFLSQNGTREKLDLFSDDKATSKKKTKSGLSLMDLVQDAERERPERQTTSTPKTLVSRFLETPQGFQHTTKRRKTSSSTSALHVKSKLRTGKKPEAVQLEPMTPVERHLIAGVSLDKLMEDDSFWET